MSIAEPLRRGEGGDRPSFPRAALAIALRRRPVTNVPAEGQLRKRLTVTDLIFIGIGASVGSGIFVISGIAAVPTGPAVCISFVIAAVSSIFSAFCYAELAARIPIAGNVYLYAYAAFGEIFALVFGINLLVDFHVGAALGMLSCATYLHTAMAHLGVRLPDPRAVAVVLAALITGTLCVGVERGLKRANGFLVAAKTAIVVLIIVVGCFKMHTDNLVPFVPFGFGPVLSTSTTCCFAYIGFGTIASAAEECVNPQRDLPIAITASLLVCALLYVGFSLVLCGIVPFREIDKTAPVAAAFGPQYADLPWVKVLVTWGAIIGILTTLITGLYSQARMYLAISRDGLIFSCLRYVSPRFGTPTSAQLACGVLAAVLAACLPLDQLVRFLNIGVLSSYTVVCAGVLVLRAEKPAPVAVGCIALGISSVAAPAIAEWTAGSESLAGQAWCRIIIYSVLAILVVASWAPLFLQKFARPLTFACPLCPFLPSLGIAVNGYLLSHCHWEAWLRLGGTTALILAGYAFRVRRLASSDAGSAEDDARCVASGVSMS